MSKNKQSSTISSLTSSNELSQLKKTELLLKSCLESPKDMIILSIDQNYNYLYFNKQHAQVMKYTYNADVKVGMNLINVISSVDDKRKSIENYSKALQGYSHSTIQEYGDRDIRVYESFYNPIIDNQNNIIGATAFARDITDKVMAERNLKNTQILMDSIINRTTDAIYVKDTHGKYLLFNKGAESFVGKKSSEVLGHDDTYIFSGDEAKIIIAKDRSIMKQAKVETFEEYVKSQEGLDAVFLSTKGPLYDQADQLIGTFGIARNITDRKKQERLLIESEQRFKLLIDLSPETIFIQTEGEFKFINKAGLKLFGVDSDSEILNHPVLDRMHPDYRLAVQKRIDQLNTQYRDVPALEEIYLGKDNQPVFVEVIAVPIVFNDKDGALVFARNIDERKKHEKEKEEWESQIQQQQKLEAIGTLAGGVAHEINNPINIMMNYAQLILDEPNISSELKEYAKSIIEDGLRVSEIVKNLLQFSRHEKTTFTYSSVHEIIKRTVSLVNTFVKGDQIKIIVQEDENVPLIMCQSQQIQQVLMNLLTNARDSLNEKYPTYHENKKILIQTHLCSKDNQQMVNIVVEDLGVGISNANLVHIFEPFFSTKPKDKGTGLGLSISFGVIKNHHGKIHVETVENEYARFIIELPVNG